MLDYEVHRCSRKCASSGRAFEPGEEFFSSLEVEGAEVIRRDYAADAWDGPVEKSLGWWKSKMPEENKSKARWAPNEVMLDLFERWENDPDHADIRYILALLLIRRRVLKEESEQKDDSNRATLVVYCPRKDQSYPVLVVTPGPTRAKEIQDELAELLFANAT